MYAAEENGGMTLNLRLSTGREVSDWEYDAIYDYYDPSTVEQAGAADAQKHANMQKPIAVMT